MSRSQSVNGDAKIGGTSTAGGGERGKGGAQSKRQFRYSREEMLSISKSKLSTTRPTYLSAEFNNEEGKFLPDKWLEYRWVCEGVENRPNVNARRKEKLKAEALEGDSTVLSPQRRGFSSGCRAASPTKNEAEGERLGANKGNWRSGAGYSLKNTSGSTDFKPSFQRSTTGGTEGIFNRNRSTNGAGSSGNWRTGEGSFKPSFHRDSQGQNRNRQSSAGSGSEEKVPEWLSEGPTSMLDMIELKGFDEEVKTKPSNNKSNRKDNQASKLQARQRQLPARAQVALVPKEKAGSIDSSTSSRPSSHVSGNGPSSTKESASSPPLQSSSQSETSSIDEKHPDPIAPSSSSEVIQESDSKQQASNLPLFDVKLPNSDAEFAAIMGLIGDGDLDSLMESDISSPKVSMPDSASTVTGSRLSRFFATSNGGSRTPQATVGGSSDSNNNAGSLSSPPLPPISQPNSVLQQIFANSPQRASPLLEPRGGASVPGVMRAEDLERNFQREAARNAAFSLPDGYEQLRALGIDPRSLPLTRQQLACSQLSKGNPLGDPHQQAQLMNKLNKFARQQDVNLAEEPFLRPGVRPGTPPSPRSSAGPQSGMGLGAPLPGAQFGHLPADPALQALMRSQYESAFIQGLQALAANQRATAVPQPPQAADVNAVRSMIAGMLAANGMAQGSAVGQSRPKSSGMPNTFMPTSVMRQMTKNSASLDEKHRRPVVGGQSDDDKHQISEEHVAASQKQVPVESVNSGLMSSAGGLNSMDTMTKLALQQQYSQVIAAMQGGLSMGAWRPPPQYTAAMRSQALAAAQAEHQRQFAIAMMRGDLNGAQAIRARFLSQQAAAVANLPNLSPSTAATPLHLQQHIQAQLAAQQASSASGAARAPTAQSNPPNFKYQNPLEKLLQSAGVPTNQAASTHSPNFEKGLGDRAPSSGSSNMPSIISRLPPQANCISVEELERQFAAN